MRHFWGFKKKQLKVIASVASDNKDEMYIPDGPKQVENTLEIKDLRGVIATPLPLGVPKRHALACPGIYQRIKNPQMCRIFFAKNHAF